MTERIEQIAKLINTNKEEEVLQALWDLEKGFVKEIVAHLGNATAGSIENHSNVIISFWHSKRIHITLDFTPTWGNEVLAAAVAQLAGHFRCNICRHPLLSPLVGWQVPLHPPCKAMKGGLAADSCWPSPEQKGRASVPFPP